MSRYFEITIGDKTWSSHDNNGLQKKGFLKIELNIVLTSIDGNPNRGNLKIWGLGLQEIFNGADYTDKPVIIKVGMAKGLPFANPNNRGTAFTGMVYFRAFPQHTGLDQYLNVQIQPGGIIPFPSEVVLEWNKGEKLSTVLERSLKGVNATIAIRDDLAFFDTTGGYSNFECKAPSRFTELQSFSKFLNFYSKQVIKESNYKGVVVVAKDRGFLITDYTKPTTAKKLEFYDFIGQPSFQSDGRFDAELIARGDIQVGDKVTFPDRMIASLNKESVAYPKDKLTLKGEYDVTSIAYNLNSRGASARDWSMIITVIKSGI